MIMGVLLNIAGFVVIFVEKGGFVDPGYALGYAHAVMGCLVLGYSLMNVIRGFLRPDLESPRRRRFKVTHFIFAGLAILLSNVNPRIYQSLLIIYSGKHHNRTVHGIAFSFCDRVRSAEWNLHALHSHLPLLAFVWRPANADSQVGADGSFRRTDCKHGLCCNYIPPERLKVRHVPLFTENIKAFRCTSMLILFAQDGVLNLSAWYLWHNQKST